MARAKIACLLIATLSACSSEEHGSNGKGSGTHLSAVEREVVGRWMGDPIEGRNHVWVLYPDRKGCMFKVRGEDITPIEQLDFTRWWIDENDRFDAFTVRIIFDVEGNEQRSDGYNLEKKQIWPSNIDDLALRKTKRTFLCHPEDDYDLPTPNDDTNAGPPDAGTIDAGANEGPAGPPPN